MNEDQRCIFCRSKGPYKSVEHIIPEGLGNDDLILEGRVCDACNQYFGSKIENYVLKSTPIGLWRVLLRIAGKKGKLPKFSAAEKSNKGRFPRAHGINDLFSIECHPDGTTSIDVCNEGIIEVMNGSKADLKIVFSPYMISMVGRFLLKIGLELLCHSGVNINDDYKYDNSRKYARYGNANELWPLFHFSKGEIPDLITQIKENEELLEEVFCYQYNIIECFGYELFALQVGVDVFIVCLNDQYPSPVIGGCFASELKLLWFSPDQF